MWRYRQATPRALYKFIAEAFATYATLYARADKLAREVVPQEPPNYAVVTSPEQAEKIRVGLAAKEKELSDAVREKVLFLLNMAVPSEQAKCMCALDPDVRDFWRFHVPHRWTACMEYGGNTDLGEYTRADAMIELKALHNEAVIFFVDDQSYYLFFRVPGAKPIGV
jgi:hypothetical protein